MIGTTIRGYRVVTELGSGGMGTVYFAEHQVIGRRAAIKILNREIATDESMVARFFTEARAVNAIRHPNIVDITDFGELDNSYFIVMEFLEGETVGARLERAGPLPEAVVRGILDQMASAVGAVHEQGIVHRDLKPENTFLSSHPDYPDFVKVLDFGLAKILAPATEAGARTTQPGLAMGTPAYMSPEQCRGDADVDPRTDVYAWGAMAFEMLAGRTPFQGTWVEQIHAHLHAEPPALRELRPEVSAELAALVMACLAKRREDRPASMRVLRDRLRGAPASPVPAAAAGRGDRTSGASTRADRPPPATPLHARSRVPPAPPRSVEAERVERQQSARVSEKLAEIIRQRLRDNRLTLPSPPLAAVRALELLNDPNCQFGKVAAVLEQDPLLASKVLRIVNSAFFAARDRVTSLEMAASRLGIKQLRRAVQEMAAETVFASRNPRIRGAFRDIWVHCLAVAQIARGLALALPRAADAETAYLAGLMHDIGKPVVAVLLLEAERSLTEEDRAWMSESLWIRTVNRSHRAVGAAIAVSWRLPSEVLEAISESHDYNPRRGPDACVNIVCLANAIAKCQGWHSGEAEPEAAAMAFRGRQLLGVGEDIEAEVIEKVREWVHVAGELLGGDREVAGDRPDPTFVPVPAARASG